MPRSRCESASQSCNPRARLAVVRPKRTRRKPGAAIAWAADALGLLGFEISPASRQEQS